MAISFKYSAHITELDTLVGLVDRLENIAYQAERAYWDSAKAEWNASRAVTAAPGTVAGLICVAAEALCNDILERFAKLADESFADITLDATLSLYAGGLFLENLLKENESKTELATGVVRVITVSDSEEQTQKASEPIMPSAIAVCEVMRKQFKWLRHVAMNVIDSGMMTAYIGVLSSSYSYIKSIIEGNVGANFPVPITAYSSGAQSYSLPKISAEASATGHLVLKCINDYTAPSTYAAPQGTGYNEIVVSDIVHLAKLEVPGYEDFADRIYVVHGVDSDSLTLAAASETLRPECVSEAAVNFGDIFVIRKLRAAT